MSDRVNEMIEAVLKGEEPANVIEAIKAIGPGGLSTIDVKLTLKPNTEYYMGASSAPARIVITKVTDDMIFYRSEPDYQKELRVQKSMGADLIKKGTETWIQSYGKYNQARASALKKALAGGPGLKANYKDLQKED